MIGYLLMLLSSVTSLAEGILIKQYNKKYLKGGFLFTALVSVFGLIYCVVSELVKGGEFNFSVEVLPYAIIAGVLYCAASIFTYIALEVGNFAITMLVLSYTLVFSICYGIFFLNEHGTVFTYIGFAAIAVSIFLVKGKSQKKAEEACSESSDTADGTPVSNNSDTAPKKKASQFSFLWVVAMVISVVGAGMFSVLQRMQQIRFEKTMDSTFMMITYAVTAVILIIAGIVKDGKDCFYILKKGVPYAGTAGIANGATNMLGMLVNTMVAISIAVPTRSALKTAISFLVSLIVFKERFDKRQIVGVILGMVAVVLLNLKI